MYIVTKNFFQAPLPNATNSLRNATNNFQVAEKQPDVFILNNLNEIKNPGLRNAIKEFNIPENSKGVVYACDSNLAKDITKSYKLNEFIKNNYDKLQSKYISKTTIEFDKFKDSDLFATLQHVTLLNPQIDTNGYFTTFIIDYYDFDSRDVHNIADYVNNWGYKMQEKGLLEKYFILIYISKKVGIQ